MSASLPKKYTFGYTNDESIVLWDVRDIWKAVESTPYTTFPISVFIGQVTHVQKQYNRSDIARINKADIKYPIIVSHIKDDNVMIIDGYHRLSRLITMGVKEVKCKVIGEMPLPHFVKGKPFEIDGLSFKWQSKFEQTRRSRTMK